MTQLFLSDRAKHCSSVPAVFVLTQPYSAQSPLQTGCTEVNKSPDLAHISSNRLLSKPYSRVSPYSFSTVPVPWHRPCHSSEQMLEETILEQHQLSSRAKHWSCWHHRRWHWSDSSLSRYPVLDTNHARSTLKGQQRCWEPLPSAGVWYRYHITHCGYWSHHLFSSFPCYFCLRLD